MLGHIREGNGQGVRPLLPTGAQGYRRTEKMSASQSARLAKLNWVALALAFAKAYWSLAPQVEAEGPATLAKGLQHLQTDSRSCSQSASRLNGTDTKQSRRHTSLRSRRSRRERFRGAPSGCTNGGKIQESAIRWPTALVK